MWRYFYLMSSEKQKLVTFVKELVIETLKDFGLTSKESEVYIYLTKSCIQKAGTISKQLKMHKAQIYRILANLRSKGLVESTFEVPMRFEAVPFKTFLDLMIKSKKEEATLLEEKRDELLDHWNSINIKCPEYSLRKFMIIEGKKNLYSMIFQMIERAEKEVLGVIDSLGLIQAVQMGLLNVLETIETRIKFLTPITTENLQKIKPVIKKLTKNTNLIVNHVDIVSGICPRFIIRDNEEAIIFLLPQETSSPDKKSENGIWTNTPAVFYTKSFFEELWHKSMNVNKKILELETEKIPRKLET
jgi:sugar-specific transcriptional regulator TrmB